MLKRIIVIEDEPAILSLYVDLLKKAGYQVDRAANGDEGFEKVKNQPWDLVLLDIMLPGVDGLRMLKEMQQQPGMKKGTVVVLSNISSEHFVQEAMGFGADTYLIKSNNTPDKVVQTVGEYLK